METRAQVEQRTDEPGIQFVGGEATVPTLLSSVGPAGLFPALDFLDACMLRRTCPDGHGEIGRHTALQGWAACGWVKTEAGKAGEAGCVDGVGAETRFDFPWGVAVSSSGVVYIADTFYHVIRRLRPAGRVTTWAGKAGEAGSVDGLGPKARLSWPGGLAINAAGTMYLTDSHTVRRLY